MVFLSYYRHLPLLNCICCNMLLCIMLKVSPNLFRAVIYSLPQVSVWPRQQHKNCVRPGVDKKLLQSNNSTLKIFVNDQHVWVRNYRRGPNWVRGTVIERKGPVLYRVKVNDQTWRRRVKQLRDSYLTPAKEETTGDCVVPEGGGGGRDMWCPRYQKLSRRIHQLRSLHQTGRSNQDQKVSNRALNQSSLPPARFQDFVHNQRTLFYSTFYYFMVCFVSSHVEVLREGNC